MNATTVVVLLKVEEFSLKIVSVAKKYAIKVPPMDRTNQSFDKTMR